MRARNPSSTGLVLPLLDRDCGRLLPDCGGEVRGVASRTLEVVGVEARGLAALVPFFKVEGLRDRVDVVEVVVAFGLADWVGAVAVEVRAGLVGEFDAGLVVGGA